MKSGRDLTWDELRDRGLAAAPEGIECEDTGAEDTLMIAYTSGTTGRPKGAVHVHGGFLVKMASEAAYQADLHPDETLYWVTDMGWIMGPWEMVGAGCAGAHAGPLRGRARLARARPRLGVGRAPPGERAGRLADADPRAQDRTGDEHVRKHDLSSLRILGSTGEPWNPEPYMWLRRGGRRRARADHQHLRRHRGRARASSRPYPVEEIKVCSLGGASHGMDVDVFDPDGQPVRGEVGELVCKQPWPGMTRGIWGDPERYLETYWSMYPGVWRHGDWALIDEDGDWFLLGRSDDTINVAGKRLGPAEVESVLVSHPAVAESAVVGVPRRDQGRGDLVLLRASGRRARRRRRGAAASWSPRSWDARSSRRGSCSSTRCRRPARRRSCGAPCAPSRSARTRATCRRPRTLRRSTASGPRSPPERTRRRSGAPASRRSPPPRRRPRGRCCRRCPMGGGSWGCARSRGRRA